METLELTLEVHLPGNKPEFITLKREMIKVGSFKAHVNLTPDVARTHGLIECNGHDNIVFVDMGCQGGTVVNNKAVGKSSRTKLKLGDIIKIGDCAILVYRSKIGDDERVFTPASEPEASDETEGSDSPVVISSPEEHWRTVGQLEAMLGSLHVMKFQLGTCRAMDEDVHALRGGIQKLWEATLATLDKAKQATCDKQ